MAALHSGRLDGAVAHWSRPWALGSWVFLTAGIVLGSWWAYYELGWGGWWFWDPVENASLLPWLLGTALLHALVVCEKRGAYGHAVLLLSIFTFSLSLLGTFVVRSGVLTSVHAFAVDPSRGLTLLLLLGLLLTCALTLFALRADIRAPMPALACCQKRGCSAQPSFYSAWPAPACCSVPSTPWCSSRSIWVHSRWAPPISIPSSCRWPSA